MKYCVLILGILFSSHLFSQTNSKDWKVDYKRSRVFVENKGQFDEFSNALTGDIKFVADFGASRIFFGEKGVSYNFREITKKSQKERAEILNRPANTALEHKQQERIAGKYLLRTDEVNMIWEKANPNVELVGLDQTPDHHSYAYNDENNVATSASNVRGFERILYKNIYPGIDIEYKVHPEVGVKYAFIVHPSAKLKHLKMVYDRDIFLEDMEIHIPTLFGDIIDHAPITFYSDDQNNDISSSYDLNGREISFDLGDYDPSKSITIDPWVQTPDFNSPETWDCVWEVDYDGSGNVYIIGGIMPMQLLKYSSTGVLQWTHNTPYDTTAWLGTFAVDDLGNSYVTQGTDYKIQMVNTSGTLVWNNTSPSGPGTQISTEFWNIAFNCDQSKMIIGGTGGNLNIHGRIYDMNMATGDVLSSQAVSGPGALFSIPPAIQEVRGMSAAPNGKYYFVTLDTIGYISDNFSLCPSSSSSLFEINSGIGWGYKSENWRQNNTGMKVVRADSNYVYIHRGNQLQRRSLTNLSIISTVAIPSGQFQSVFLGGNQSHNAGIDIDQCGNIYVGSTNGVYKFNSSLVQTGFYPTSFNVYDVRVSIAGDIVACGGNGTPSNSVRTGGVQSFAAAACAPISFSCCNTTICTPDVLCVTDPLFPLVTATPGGTWSGAFVDASGNFDPAAAGVGVHNVTYTLPCGSETISIVVSSCTGLVLCVDSLGVLQVSGGIGPYTWSDSTAATSTPITNQTECQNCGYTWFFGSCLDGIIPVTNCVTPGGWTVYATGSSANPPTSFPLLVQDSLGASIMIDSMGQIAPCAINPCSGVTISMNIVNQTDPLCNGGSDGTAVVSASGGTAPYDYAWIPGSMIGPSQSALSAGTYTVAIQDSNGCTGSGTVVIGEPVQLIPTVFPTDASCGANNGSAVASATGGTGTYTFDWSPGGATGGSVTGLAPNNYVLTVTDQNGCSDSIPFTIGTTGGPTLTLTSSTDVSCFGGSDGTATVSATGGSPGYTYDWSPGSLTGASQSGLSATTYTVTVTDSSGCVDIISVPINEPLELTIDTTSITPANCGASDGAASVAGAGGIGTLVYTWSPNVSTSATASGITAGIYTVTVTDDNNCTASTTFTVPSNGGATITVDNVTDASCFGMSDGSATITATGGTPPYNYDWLPTGGSAATATGLAAGSYSVTVTDNAGCVSVQNITVGEPTEIILSGTVVDEDCAQSNGSIAISASGGQPGYTYSWSPGGETTSSITGLEAGTYSVTVMDAAGCTATASYTVAVIGALNVDATPEISTIVSGGSAQITTTGASTYVWTPSTGLSCTTCPNPVASPTTTTTYIVVGTDAFGCTGSDTITVYVMPSCGGIFVPNIFSPNGTGNKANETLCVYGDCITELSYTVYNRWGEIVFKTDDKTICWDGNYKGKPAITGVYVYRLSVVLDNGEVIEESGNVTLVR